MNTRSNVNRLGYRSLWLCSALIIAATASEVGACDVCAVYTGVELRERRTGPEVAIAEQFSRFTTLQQGGDEIPNSEGERLESSITQLVASWAFTPRFAARIAAPIIVRTFRRSTEEGIERGRVWGPGDTTLLGEANVWSLVTEQMVARMTLSAGIKLPTGSTDSLGDEVSEHAEEGEGHGEQTLEEHGHESGIHDHDLSLGSGSFDGIFGGRMFLSFNRWFATGAIQYSLRTEGDFDYEFADQLTWSGGPGYLLVVQHDRLLGVQASFTGESKGKDSLANEMVGDTAITSLYIGPAIFLTSGSNSVVEIAGELPIFQNNTGLQIVPDWRLRGSVSLRF